MQGIVGGVCPNHARVQCFGHGWALFCSKSARQWWDIQPSLPDGMLWYRRRTQPDWMRIWPKVPAQTWVRHEMHSCCDVFYPRCSFPACSLRHGRCMEGGDTERPTFFLYNIHILVSTFHQPSRDIPSAVSSKTRLTWSDRTFTP